MRCAHGCIFFQKIIKALRVMEPIIEIVEPKLFAGAVADEIVATIEENISEQGSCSISLAGGRTPGSVYRLLSRPPRVGRIDWSKIRFYWGDERWVPHDDDQSNYHMVAETLLSNLTDSSKPEVFPVDTSQSSPKKAAEKYAEQIVENEKKTDKGIPYFDLVILGLGEDGHFASIFPGDKWGKRKEKIAYAVNPNSKDSERITISPDVLLASSRILFIVTGDGKSEIVSRVLEGEEKADIIPAKAFIEIPNKVTWFVDTCSASKLSR